MEKLLLEYLPILVFLGIAIVLSAALIALPLVIAPSKPDPEKLSAYECGFNAFGDSRMKFDVRFYLVSILFIIFDLEVAFLFPWAVSLGAIGMFGFWSMMEFLLVLTVGFVYEWRKGALEWEWQPRRRTCCCGKPNGNRVRPSPFRSMPGPACGSMPTCSPGTSSCPG